MILPLLLEAGVVLSYAVVGLALMLIGYLIFDVLTPGKLHELLWQHRSKNAAILVGSSLFAVAIIVATAIRASADDLLLGLLSTFLYGMLGLILQAGSFFLIDLVTPGRNADMVSEDRIHPAMWVTAVANLGISLIMASAIL